MTNQESEAPASAMSITEHELAQCQRATNPGVTELTELKGRGHALPSTVAGPRSPTPP
jgi:hypothetical protein